MINSFNSSIEIILLMILSLIFYLYLRKIPELIKPNEPDKEKEKNKEAIRQAQTPVSENQEVIEIIDQANKHYGNQEWNRAEKLYLKAAMLDPQCVKAYSRLGVIYLKNQKDKNNLEDAKDALKQALTLDPENGYILNNLGLVYYNQEKYDKAIDCFERSIKADANQANRFANLGISLFAKRQFAKAERVLKKAVNLDPDNHEYHDLLKETSDKKKSHRALIK